MKKLIISGIVFVAAIIGIVIVLKNNQAKNKAQVDAVAKKNAGVTVRVAEATMQDMNIQYTTNGVFIPQQEVSISAETSGKVVSVLVKEGSRVAAGQTLAIIKGDKQNVAVTNAQASYNNAKAEVARFENAYATGGVTKQQLDQVRLQLENAKNNLQSSQLNASDVNVKASFSGIVNTKTVEPGSYVNPGQAMFTVVNISTLKLKVNVDEKTVGSVKMGQNVLIESAALSGQKWSGVVTFIAPKADGSLNFPVELEVRNNGTNDLKAGMYGTAIFGEQQLSTVLVIPRNAFVGNVSSNKVFVAQNGKAILKEVVSGRNFGDYIEILSGVSKGDIVITTGQINLTNETPIEIIK